MAGSVSRLGHRRVRETLLSSGPRHGPPGPGNELTFGQRSHNQQGQRAQWAFVPRGQWGRLDAGFSVTEGHVSGATSRHLPGPRLLGRGPDGRSFTVKCVATCFVASDIHLPRFCSALVVAELEKSSPFLWLNLKSSHVADSAFIRGLFF